MSVQGISFYDFIGKLIPGLLLIGLPLAPLFLWVDTNLLEGAVLIALAYVVGLIWDLLINLLFPCLRRNKCLLTKSYDDYEKANNPISLPHRIKIPSNIVKRYDCAYYLIMHHNMLGNIPRQEAHENFLKNIWPILLFYIIKILCEHKCICLMSCCCKACVIIFLLLLIIIPFAWYKIQMKIFYSVWDSAYWTLKHA